MTLKQQLFVEAYLGNGGIAAAAARTAGYTGSDETLWTTGCRNLKKPKILSAIKARTGALVADKGIMAADEVLIRLTRVARSSVSLLLDEDGRPCTKAALKNGVADLIKSVTITKTRYGENVTITLYDAQAAIVQLGRYHGLFIDRVVSDTLTAAFTDQVADVVAHIASEFLIEKEVCGEYLQAIESGLSCLNGGPIPPDTAD